MTDELQQALDVARQALASQASGHLPRSARLPVLVALGPDDPQDRSSYPRLVAQAAIVERALPVWAAERPEDNRPALLVSASLSSSETVAVACERAPDFRDEIFEAYGDETLTDEAGAAGEAAVALIATAGYGNDDDYAPGIDDPELEPDQWSPEYEAEIALTSDDPTVNVEQRRALWTWWLEEAVPVAARAGLRPE